MHIKILIISAFVLLGCTSSKSRNVDQKWSIIMADAVITRYDSLVYYNGQRRIKWQYDVAMLGYAIDMLGDINKKYSNYLSDYIDCFIDDQGNISKYKLSDYNLDNINPAKALFTLYKRTGEEKYRIAIEKFFDQLKTQPRTYSGGFWHKKIYPWQMWLDGVYMSSPFIAQYAREFNHPEWYDTIFHQISLIYSNTLDSESGLLYHAWDESRTQRWCDSSTGRSKHFWSRAMGWYTMALVDVLDYIPEDYARRDSIISILNNVCEALSKIRSRENKLWYQVLDMPDREGNYPEASGTFMFIYVFAKGADKYYLPPKYSRIAEDSFDAAVKHFIITDTDGMPTIVNICGGCGLGGKPYRDGSYEYYITEKRVNNDPKGVAPFILAAIELEK
jgi:unsaturated rhamnogalacturonyl hydrolase